VRRDARHHQRTTIPKPRTAAAPTRPMPRPQPQPAPKPLADRGPDRVACARNELRLGHASTAERLARELLAEGNDDAAVHAVLLHALGNLGRALEASAAADVAVARHPLDPELRYLAAALLLAAGRPYEAAESPAAVAYADPGLAAAHML